MTKYTNPFHTLHEAQAILRSQGLYLTSNNASWAEEILGIQLDKVYADGSHYYKVDIHLNEKGFGEAIELINEVQVSRRSFTDEFDMLWVDPSPLLKLFALVPRGESE